MSYLTTVKIGGSDEVFRAQSASEKAVKDSIIEKSDKLHT